MDERPFDRWYGTEHPKVLAVLAVAAGDAHLAQEAADEAFVRAYERWSRVSQMAAPAAWTYQTALNVVRRRARRSELEARLRIGTAPNATDVAPPPDWSPEVWDALRRLPPRERTAIALRYVADLSTADTATAMRVAPGTVGSTLHSARRHLALLLGDDEAAEIPVLDLEEVSDA